MIEIVSFIGGVFLVIGAFFLARGNVYASVIAYFIADVMWVLMAASQRAWISAGMIAFGMACGIYVWWNMERGKYRKSIKKTKE